MSASREIRIRTDSANASDDADLDYEAVSVSYGSTTPPPTGSWWKPQKGLPWWWQLENAGSLNTGLNVDVYDIDLFEGRETGKIGTLKSKGYRVICYFSAGTYEDFRPDSSEATQIAQDLPETHPVGTAASSAGTAVTAIRAQALEYLKGVFKLRHAR